VTVLAGEPSPALAIAEYRADLHVHTVLSPCASRDMLPPQIVAHTLALGLRIIAVTDHNASANARAVQEAAAGTPLTILPGMELQTAEEVHLLCLFATVEQLSAWQAEVDARMPRQENQPDAFGPQVVVDAAGAVVRSERRLLATSVALGLEEAAWMVRERGGLAIPAHVDRPVNSLSAMLGFPPPGLVVDALEISAHTTPEAARRRLPWLTGYPLVQGGDVHHLEGFRASTVFRLAAPTLAEIRLALKGAWGRSCSIIPR